MFKKFLVFLLALVLSAGMGACNEKNENPNASEEGDDALKGTIYTASDIGNFGSGTPAGVASYNEEDDTVSIWNIDASLDNYGGIQTPSMELDFSKAVIFQMEVVSCYTQYIVKLSVAGEKEYYYVLSDEGTTGLISVNVVDAMLCDKYRAKNTQPDPGYATGWKYEGQKKNCTFHILAKGPSGEQQTAEVVVKSIAIYNDQEAVTDVIISGSENLIAKKGSEPVQLSAVIEPQSVEDKSILWSSADESVATVSDSGLVNFVGVGRTTITATSKIDQSKQESVEVRVLSGYEMQSDFKTALSSLRENDTEKFTDLFLTEWDDMYADLSVTQKSALETEYKDGKLYIENYFTVENNAMQNEAASSAEGNYAVTKARLSDANGATVYALVDGKVEKSDYSGGIPLRYAEKNGTLYGKTDTYAEYIIVEYADGKVEKFCADVVAVTAVERYVAADFADASKWTIPDRNKQSEDSVVHALSPASVQIENGAAVIKQNKYAESAFCFGGIVSDVLRVDEGDAVQVVLDVAELNRKSEYVKTMWELKIIYYENGRAVSANPFTVESANETGKFTINFTAQYAQFRFYLVVNGSDIGEQFPDAQMKIGSMKIQTLDR